MDQGQALHDVGSLSEDADPATDYSMLASHEMAGIYSGLQVSGVLEAASIRHCLVADIVAQVLGHNVMIGHTIVAVCDEQLAAAGALVLATGEYIEAELTYYADARTTDQFPGFSFVVKGYDFGTDPARIMVIPGSYWHLDLGIDSYARNTVLVPEPRCRFPNKLFYIDALINTIAERTRKPEGLNGLISSYLRYQLVNVRYSVPKSLLARLPPEDILFLDLYDKVMLPSARAKLCVEHDKIRRGETTVEEARTRIPRKDLAFAKFKAEYEARVKESSAAGDSERKSAAEAS